MSSPAPTNTTNTSAVAPTATATAPASASAVQAQGPEPHITTLQHAARIAIQHDRPIMLDYYVDTATGKAFIGEDIDTKEKVLVKSKDEFTSSVQRSFRVGEDFIILTENSLYIVNGMIGKKRISMAALNGEEL